MWPRPELRNLGRFSGFRWQENARHDEKKQEARLMRRTLLILAAVVVGLGVGLTVADRTFENAPQQITLVRNTAIVAAALCVVYFAIRKRVQAAETKDVHPNF
jgi:xanthine/uracil permease